MDRNASRDGACRVIRRSWCFWVPMCGLWVRSERRGRAVPERGSGRLDRQFLDEDRRLDAHRRVPAPHPPSRTSTSNSERFTTGGGTFATGLEHLDEWLDEFRPTVVVFNYGGNDAGAGREGLARVQGQHGRGASTRAEGAGARVILVTPQAADVRKSGAEAAAKRTLYAETMLAFGRERGLDRDRRPPPAGGHAAGQPARRPGLHDPQGHDPPDRPRLHRLGLLLLRPPRPALRAERCGPDGRRAR